MNKLARLATIAAALAFVAIGIALVTASPGVAQGGNGGPRVTVVNKVNEAVPTKVVDSVPLQATIVGPLPVPADQREPFKYQGDLTVPLEVRVASDTAFTVPDDKRLVVEYVTLSAGDEFGGLPREHISLRLGSGLTTEKFYIGSVTPNGNVVRSLSLRTKFFISPGNTLFARADRQGDRFFVVPVRYTVTGYLEPL